MNPTFTIKLEQQILSGLVTTGKYDGKVPSIACATTGGKVLIHSPHEVNNNSGQLNAIRYLNLNRQITAITSGSLAKPDSSHRPDNIYIGSRSNLLGYNVERNSDTFFVDVQDGVNSLVIGKLGHSPKPFVMAGGNCSILGFDESGNESFWTVTGDNVSAMTICDLNANGKPLLLVGSDDFEIRAFDQEELISEVTEADRVTILTSIGSTSKFAYGLANGTIGVYTGLKNRLWRVKTKNKVTALCSYDLDMDGVPEIFSGWNNGSFNVRRVETGEVIFKQNLNSPIASILKSDYRMDGKEEVMICSEAGEIRAYLASDVELGTVGTLAKNGINKDSMIDQKALNDLQEKKLQLLSELKQLEKAVKSSKTSEVPVGMLPHNTNLTYHIEPDLKVGAITLKVEVNTDVQIVNVIAVDLEGVVLPDREVIAISPKAQSKIAILPLKPIKYSSCSLRIQTHLASRSLGILLHVYETTISIPKFGVFKYIENSSGYQIPSEYPIPASHVTFTIKESLDRMLTWIQSVFLFTNKLIKSENGKQTLFFVSVSNVKTNNINAKNNTQDINNNNIPEVLLFNLQNINEFGQSYLKIKLQCDNMDLAGELMQDLIKYFNIDELESSADFPLEFQKFEEVIKCVNDCNTARMNLTADMADDSQRIKAQIIRAEDARLMNEMKTMRKSYTELNSLNGQLINGYNIRTQNQELLLNALKEVNIMIQRAANIRTGKAKNRVITECRIAVKANNMKSIFRIIKSGHDTNQISKIN